MKTGLKGIIISAWFMISAVVPVSAQQPITAEAVLSRANAECVSNDQGTLSVQEGAIAVADLTKDGTLDQLVDFSKISCSSALTLWCGTGGCALSIIADGTETEFQAHRWTVVEWDNRPIILLNIHGTGCAAAGAEPCYQAFFWHDGAFRTAQP